jgi:hypothetical protein
MRCSTAAAILNGREDTDIRSRIPLRFRRCSLAAGTLGVTLVLGFGGASAQSVRGTVVDLFGNAVRGVVVQLLG